jgi:hypothetical protein
MKLDPGMHIGLHLVFFGKTSVTKAEMIKGLEAWWIWWYVLLAN